MSTPNVTDLVARLAEAEGAIRRLAPRVGASNDVAHSPELAEVRLMGHANTIADARMALDATARDAARWRALLASDRIRVLGAAFVGAPAMHLGLELWIIHSATRAESQRGREYLTLYVDAAISIGKGGE